MNTADSTAKTQSNPTPPNPRVSAPVAVARTSAVPLAVDAAVRAFYCGRGAPTPWIFRPYSRCRWSRRLSDPKTMCLDMSGE